MIASINSLGVRIMKLSRKAIKEGLEQVPIEAVLLGAVNPGGITLTHKEKTFAEELVKGATKSDAYRKAYKPKGKNTTINKRAHEVSKREGVIGYTESLKAAMEAQRFATPAHLRALAIHKLTEGAIDPTMPPAQRVKCLELIGKITEVALFTERRETVTIKRSDDAKTVLLQSIQAAIKNNAVDTDFTEGDELLAELVSLKLQGPGHDENAEGAEPPIPDPPSLSETREHPMLSNPHIDSPAQTSPGTQSDVLTETETTQNDK